MKILKFTFLSLLGMLLFAACNKDDDGTTDGPGEPSDKECQLTDVSIRVDESTTFGIFGVAYDADGRITEAGLQTYEMTYNTEGQLTNALLPGDNFSPRVEFVYTYNAAGELTEAKSLWGEGAQQEERYVYTPTYVNGFIDNVSRTGLFDGELDYDFDSNGNPLKWTDPIFDDYTIYTFDSSQKGLFDNLSHTQAFVYGLAINQPFFHFNNAVTSADEYSEDGTLDESSVFSNNKFNSEGFQTEANDPDGKQYVFEYECN